MPSPRTLSAVALLAALAATPARADIYMYRDGQGSLHFSNAPTDERYRYYLGEAVARDSVAWRRPGLERGGWTKASWASAAWPVPRWGWDAGSAAGRGYRGRLGRADGARRKAFDKLIREAAQRHQIDSALVKAVIRTESDFVPHAVSPKGALGLMQLMPATARMRGVGSAFDPQQNIDGGVRHLRYLMDRYGGNLRLALAAYNAGEGAVDRHGGVPPYPETWDYLTKVLAFQDTYRREH